MLDELKQALSDAKLPDTVKLPLTVLVKALSWLPWVFVGIGILLNKELFIYWLAFFIFVEGLLFVVLAYLLVLLVRSSLTAAPHIGQRPSGHSETKSENIGDAVRRGVIGNAAFYLFILAAFIIAKGMGVLDRIWQSLIRNITGHPGGRLRGHSQQRAAICYSLFVPSGTDFPLLPTGRR